MGKVYDDRESAYLRKLEFEYHCLSGTEITYYRLVPGNFDPVYGEGDFEYVSYGPMIAVLRYVEAEGRQTEGSDQGGEYKYDGRLTIPRNAWEAIDELKDLSPKEGDVVFGFGEYWDLSRAGRGGNINDTATTVGWSFDLAKNSAFDPERKVNG